MTIQAKALADDPADLDVGLKICDSGDTFEQNFGDLTWTRTRRRAGDLHVFNVVRITGASNNTVKYIDGEAVVFSDVDIGDYIAYDSWIVWHIPAADLDPDFDPEGGTYETVDMSGGPH